MRPESHIPGQPAVGPTAIANRCFQGFPINDFNSIYQAISLPISQIDISSQSAQHGVKQ